MDRGRKKSNIALLGFKAFDDDQLRLGSITAMHREIDRHLDCLDYVLYREVAKSCADCLINAEKIVRQPIMRLSIKDEGL